MQIPIQNVFYLFCYAWDQFREGLKTDVGGVDSPRLQDLIAKVLIVSINRLLRRGLDRGYIERGEDTVRLRGRFDFGETIKRNLMHRRLIHCRVDELKPDVLINQILKATARRLAIVDELDQSFAHTLRLQCKELREVSDIELTRASFAKLQIHGLNAEYRFLMRVCELAYHELLPNENDQGYRFADILEDDVRMNDVFENFVRNFYKRECKTYRLGSRNIEWATDTLTESARAVLPAMVNDIRLDGQDRTIVIDAKYYKDMFQRYFDTRKLISGNLYQIFTYVSNLSAQLEKPRKLQGILLYPTVDDDFDESFNVVGHSLKVSTINLNQPWQSIHRSLLALVEENRGVSGADA